MRVITTTTTVFTFEELSDTAKDTAVEKIRERLAGLWWDSSDNDDVSESMVYSFADTLGTPGVDTHGTADFTFPGGIKLIGWDLERGSSILFTGILTRDNAPKLPWVDTIECVQLNDSPHFGYRSAIYIAEADSDDFEGDLSQADVDAMTTAVRDALDTALTAGRATMEYKTSEEYAREWAENNDDTREYTEEGSLYF